MLREIGISESSLTSDIQDTSIGRLHVNKDFKPNSLDSFVKRNYDSQQCCIYYMPCRTVNNVVYIICLAGQSTMLYILYALHTVCRTSE